MSDRSDADGRVIELACARFEDALAEGRLDEHARAHARSCPDCRALEAELDEIGRDVAEATRSSTPGAGFVDGVLERARDLGAGDVEASSSRSHAPRRRLLSVAAVAATAAAATTVLILALGPGIGEEPAPTPQRVEAGEAPAPEGPPRTRSEEATRGATPPKPPRSRGRGGGGSPARSRAAAVADEEADRHPAKGPPSKGDPAKEDEEAPSAPSETGSARPEPVPEPAEALPKRVRASLLRAIRRDDGCPEHASAPVRATLTLAPEGKLADRQLLSSGPAEAAHRCVDRALDAMLVPPRKEPATITVELSW